MIIIAGKGYYHGYASLFETFSNEFLLASWNKSYELKNIPDPVNVRDTIERTIIRRVMGGW